MKFKDPLASYRGLILFAGVNDEYCELRALSMKTDADFFISLNKMLCPEIKSSLGCNQGTNAQKMNSVVCCPDFSTRIGKGQQRKLPSSFLGKVTINLIFL